jgi:hypothetical protein
MEALGQALHVAQESIERLRPQRTGQLRLQLPRAGGGAPAQDETQAQLFRFLEQDLRGIERHAGVIQVVVIGNRAAARAHQFDHADARGQAEQPGIELGAIAIGRGRQPGRERGIDAQRIPFSSDWNR